MKEPAEWIKNPFNNCRQSEAFNSLHRIWQPSADFRFYPLVNSQSSSTLVLELEEPVQCDSPVKWIWNQT